MGSAPRRARVGDLPAAWHVLPVIAWAGLALGVVLAIAGLTIDGIDSNRDACTPIGAHDLWPLPLAAPVLCWLGLAGAVAGTLAARQLNVRLSAGPTGSSRWRALVVVGIVASVIIGAAVLYLIYVTEFLTVPICVSEALIGGFPR